MFKIGDRVDVNGSRGTVRYVGSVDGYAGEWVGIDWDSPERGKHDGSVKGKRYFQANSAKSGSFVRPQTISPGKDLLEEMNFRYNDFSSQPDTLQLSSKNVDLINMEKIHRKQNNLWQLRVVIMDGMNVSRAPPKDCPPFRFCSELSLHNNLLSRWCDLLDVLEFFPSLNFLIASYNYMENGMTTLADGRKVSAPIRTLVLGNCRIDENTAKRLLHVFPRVREIHLVRNGLKTFDPGENGGNLESIDLEGNPINDFRNLHVLSTLPDLQNLRLENCGLCNIQMPDPIGFSSLSSLNIRGNPIEINQWLSELVKLPALEKLVCHSSHECSDSGLHGFEIIIAKMPQLKVIGNSTITANERQSSEIHFLNKFGVPPVAEENRADVERLIKVHGEPATSSVADTGIGLVKLRLSYEGKIVERSFPETVIVQRLIGIVSRLFHLDARKISLQIRGDDQFVIDLDKPLRPLNFYSLSNDDTIYVKFCDV